MKIRQDLDPDLTLQKRLITDTTKLPKSAWIWIRNLDYSPASYGFWIRVRAFTKKKLDPDLTLQ